MLKRIRSQLLAAVDYLENGFEWLTRFPKHLRRIANQRRPKGWRLVLHWLLRLVAIPLAFLGWIALIPRQIRKGLKGNRLREFLYALPAILVLILVAVVLIRGYLIADDVINKYRSIGSNALVENDFEKAKIYFARILSETENPESQDRFNWFLTLANTGNQALATKVLNELAPEDRAGFPMAHKIKAVTIASSLADQQLDDPDILKKFKHHLDHSQETNSLEIQQAWASYYAKTEQTELEIKSLRNAAKINPTMLLMLANRYSELGRTEERGAVLDDAVSQFTKKITTEPLDTDSAILLAKAMVMQGDIDSAEVVLLKGYRIRPEPAIKKAVADIYVVRYDLEKDASFVEKVDLLKKAIGFSPSSIVPYERMIGLYRESVGQGQQQELIALLQDQAVAGKTPAATHFALGNLLWLDGRVEKAKWHMEQAYRLDPQFAFIANNLAWLLAHDSKSPDLNRALEVSTEVVKRFPDEPRFRDTLATIMMKQGKLREASVEYEKCLVTIRESSKKKIHQNLAQIYRQLGQGELAAKHQQTAAAIAD